jgi:c-di-GMP phosphodiesterase
MRLQEKNSEKLILPAHFLDVAIKTRQYDELSSSTIFKALDLIKSSSHTLSINFTYSDIKNILFTEQLKDFFTKNSNVGNRTVFEITESESIENYDDVKAFIKCFRVYGVKIAIDDFGAGFSNFEYILEIEPDYLKIDGSLIKNIDKDPKAHTLVEAIVQFSHKLEIKIIAEYVHSQQIFEMLKELNVDEYQGFYFYEPLPYTNL